jgi:hypothetical protein
LLRAVELNTLVQHRAHCRAVLALSICVLASAGALAFPRPAPGDARPHHHPLGWSFDLPAGWRVHDVKRASALAPPGTTYDPARGDLAQAFAVSAADHIGDPVRAAVVPRLLEILAKNGFEPLGKPKQETAALDGRSIVKYVWTYRPRRRAPFMETRLYLVPGSPVTLILLAAGEQDLVAPHDAELLRLAASLKFDSRKPLASAQWSDWGFEREQPPGPGMPDPGDVLADPSVPSQQWLFYLRGKRLTPAPGGEARGKSVLLLPDGTFECNAQAGSAAKPPRCRWRIVTRARVTALVLYWHKGPPSYHRLERRGDAILVDEVRSTVTEP